MADQPKVLRVAILQGKKLVQERLIEAGQPVTVGTSAKNSFVFPETHLPSQQFVLFRPLSGRTYALHFTEQMANKSSKLKAGGVGTSLLKIKDDPSVKSKGGLYTLPLTIEDKGKVVIEKDKIAVLFQFVDEPAREAVKPLRAMDFRPRFMEDDDPLFLGFLAIWMALAVVFVIWAINTEIAEFELEELPDRFTKLVIEKEEPKEPPDNDKSKDKIDPNKEGKGKKEKAKKAEKAKKGPKNKVDAAKQKEALKRKIAQNSKLIGLIGTLGESDSVVASVWGGDAGLKDLDGALASDGGLSLNTDEVLRAGSGGDADAVDSGEVGGIGGGGGGDGVEGVAVKVEARVDSDGSEDLSAFEGDKGSVKQTVRRYNAQLKYCYEQRLKVNPNLQGRVEISWTVMSERVSDVYVVSNQTGDAELASCLTGKIKKWKFPAGVEGDVTWPFVFRASK